MDKSSQTLEILRKVKQDFKYQPNFVHVAAGRLKFSIVAVKSKEEFIVIASTGCFCFMDKGEKKMGTLQHKETILAGIQDLVYSPMNDCYYGISFIDPKKKKVLFQLKTKPEFQVKKFNLNMKPKNFIGKSLRITEDGRGMIILQNNFQYLYLDLYSHQWFPLVGSSVAFQSHGCLSRNRFICLAMEGDGFIVKYDPRSKKISAKIKIDGRVDGLTEVSVIEIDKEKDNLFMIPKKKKQHRYIYVFKISQRGRSLKFKIPYGDDLKGSYSLAFHRIAPSVTILTLMDVNFKSKLFACGFDETTGDAWEFTSISKQTKSKSPLGFINKDGIVYGSDFGKGLIRFSYSLSNEEVNNQNSLRKLGK